MATTLLNAVGTFVGFLNGGMIAWLKIPPFIVTLGGMLLFQGADTGFTQSIMRRDKNTDTDTQQLLKVCPALGETAA